MDEFFDTCAEIESTMCMIYRRLADAVRGNERLRELMLQMAKDEADHANQVRFARVIPLADNNFKPKISSVKLDLLLLKAQSLLRAIEDEPPSEKEVLAQAIGLEEEFMGVHISTAFEFKDEKLMERFKQLAREDEKHVATLREYYREIYQRSA